MRAIHALRHSARARLRARFVGLSVLVLIAGASAVLVAATHAAQSPAYAAIDLGTLGGTATEALAITADGSVVGNSLAPDGWHGFMWTKQEGMVDLGTLGGHTSVVGAGFLASSPVNNAGEVVGQSETADGQLQAYVWTKQDGMIALPTPEGTNSCGASAINNAGLIVGSCQTGDGVHAVVWTR